MVIRLSVRARLALLVFVVAVPLLLVSVIIVWHLTDRERAAQRDAVMYSSRAVFSAVDAQLGKYVAVGQSLASYMSAHTDDAARFCEQAAHAIAGLTGAWAVLADRRGRQLANTQRPGCWQTLPEMFGRPEMVTALNRMAATKQVEVAGVHLSPKRKIPVIAVGIPVLAAGAPRYFVALVADTTVFLDLLNSQRMPEGWLGSIIDRSGNFVARSRDYERWVGKPVSPGNRRIVTNKEGFFELRSVDGDLIDKANFISPLSGWSIGVSMQKDVFEAPIRRTMLVAALVSGAATVLSILLAIWVARKITKPIQALADGAAVLQRGEPVSFQPTGVPEVDRALNAFGTASETLLRHEMALSESENRLRTIIEGALDGIITSDEHGVIQSFNSAASQLFGYEPQEAIGQSISMLMPEPHRGRHERYLKDYATRADHAVCKSREVEALRKDGSVVPIELAVSEATYNGKRIFIAILSDITERHQADERRQLLSRELSHRVKNMLAVVQSIAHHTANSAKDTKAFSDAFSARIQALAISQDELSNTEWTGADLESLIRNHLAPFVGQDSARLRIGGTPVLVTSEKVTALGMVTHELGTNAAKYGAWSNDDGVVNVNWRLCTNGQGQVLTVEWTEHGGPPPAPSTRRGFGTKMIGASVDIIERRFEPDGLVCRFSLALAPRSADKPPHRATVRNPG
jgi:PAS domain S-box-containing protein